MQRRRARGIKAEGVKGFSGNKLTDGLQRVSLYPLTAHAFFSLPLESQAAETP